MLNCHWSRAATGKQCLVSMCAGSLWSCPTLCDPVGCGLPGLSVREEGSPSKNTGAYWPMLVAIPSRALYFLLPWPPTPLSTWCCQNPYDPSSCTTSTPASQGQTQVLQGSPRSKPQWTTHIVEMEIKPQLKPRGSLAKEEDLKPFHQLYKLQIKSTRSTRQTLCLWNI